MRAALLLVALLATWSSPMGYPCLVLLRKCFGATLAFRLELSLSSFPAKTENQITLDWLEQGGTLGSPASCGAGARFRARASAAWNAEGLRKMRAAREHERGMA